MGQSALYALDDLVLELNLERSGREALDALLLELSWVRIHSSNSKPSLCLSVAPDNDGFRTPRNCREVFRADGFLGVASASDFYLTDGSSVFHLRPASGEGYARLAPSFFTKPRLAQANFWCFGLLKLLRTLGIYCLHAASLVSRDGGGLLLVGASGSGKSTLAIGLIRAGWRYLSDDAVLLRHGSQGVEALACRRSFYVDARRSADYSDLSLGDEAPDSNGGRRRKVGINESYPENYVSLCFPRVVIFPRIKRQDQSMLKPIDSVHALGLLLAQSAPQLFDRSTMAGHLEVLKTLLQQTETYELNSGTDLYREPATLVDFIKEAQGRKNCRELSLS